MANFGEMQLATSFQWLPPGWMVEVKERATGVRRDMIYIDPVRGYKFRSKLDVLRYLGIMEPSTPNKRDGNNLTNSIRVVQDGALEKSFDWLPLNWQVEFKETKNHRVDKYYIHPVSGYKFRSKQEVSRYLQNGEMPKDRHKRRRVNDAELTGCKCLVSLNSCTAAKIPKQARSGTRRSITTRQSSITSKVENNKRVLRLSDVYASDRSWKGMECYELSCAENDYILALSAVSLQRQHVQNSVGKSSNEKVKPSPQETDYERAHGVPCRTSRRLAGLEPELLPRTEQGKQIVLTESTAEDTEKDMQSLGGEEKPTGLGKTYEYGVAAAEYTMSRDEGGTAKVTQFVGCEEQPNELGKTSEDGDALEDYPMKLASRGPESKITVPRVEVDIEKDMHSLGGIEQPNELQKTSDIKNAPADYSMKLPSEKEKSKTTRPRIKAGTRKVKHSVGAKKQPNESRKTSEDKDTAAVFAMKVAYGGAQSGFTETLDPCLEFAYKTLTGIIPLENLPIKGFFHQHVTSVSTHNTGCLKWQDLHGMASLSLN